jgi:hypothetical protein
MTVLMTLEVPGGTTAQYDRANAVMGITGDADPPHGLVVHTCAVTDDGILIIDVWDSPGSFEEFWRDRLSAALAEVGLDTATPQLSPVHALILGKGKEPNVLVLLHASGVTADQYDTLVARMPTLGDRENHPAVFHVAAIEPDGLHTVGVWDSEAASKEFAQSQLFPVIDNPHHFVLRFWRVHNYLRAQPPGES